MSGYDRNKVKGFAEEQGHIVKEVRPVEGEDWTCSLKCQHPGRRPYYIHIDDGDLRISLLPNWHFHKDGLSHTFYEIPPRQMLLLLEGLEGI